jgi:hypothetical protein
LAKGIAVGGPNGRGCPRGKVKGTPRLPGKNYSAP